MCHNLGMHSMNIRQLRDTRRLKTWLRAGNTVELRERDRRHRPDRSRGSSRGARQVARLRSSRQKDFRRPRVARV